MYFAPCMSSFGVVVTGLLYSLPKRNAIYESHIASCHCRVQICRLLLFAFLLELPQVRATVCCKYATSIGKLSRSCLQQHVRLVEFCDAPSTPQSDHACVTDPCVCVCVRTCAAYTAESCPP